MFDILTILPGRKKTNAKGWVSFNAVCCHNRGHRADKKGRGGIRKEGNNWTYHCFNCSFSCSFTLGKTISQNTRKLLTWCGIDETQIDKWSFESFQKRSLLELLLTDKGKPKQRIRFVDTELPPNAELIDKSNKDHLKFIEYINSRGLSINDYPFMVSTKDTGRNANRIIIPYTYKDRIVGYISRYLDDRFPKYIKEQQTGYVFGLDLQKKNWQYCIVTEGVIDALSVNGCALTHNTISDEQAQLLYGLNRTIIVVPDFDKAGLVLCERALELGFQVSMPDWDIGIKDPNDAVKKYGKVATVLSILQNATSSRIKIDLMRKKIAKRISN